MPVLDIPGFAEILTRKRRATVEVAAHDLTAQPHGPAGGETVLDPSGPCSNIKLNDGDGIVDERRCSPKNPADTASGPDELPLSPDGIEAFQDNDNHVIYLFLRYPEPELGMAGHEETYYNLEQQTFHWECQVLCFSLYS